MFSIRRYVTFVGLVGFIILLFFFFRDPFTTTGTSASRPTKFTQASLTDPRTGRLQWELVPVRYPVKSLIELPIDEPHRLPAVQYQFSAETASQAAIRVSRQNAVWETFQRCWKSYRKLAWMKDEVSPITGAPLDTFGGWAATLVDSLDTLWIMDMKADFEAAVEAAMAIDLSESTDITINVFETTIRHLGGLLSAYDLSGDHRLLQKAKEFGDMLIVAFDTPNRMPITRWKPFSTFGQAQIADTAVLVAEVGSLSLEFTRLSQITGDSKWYDAVTRIAHIMERQQFKTRLPGMWPVTINAEEADFTGDSLFTLSAMADSVYEYFPKMHALLGGVDPMYRKMYEGSMMTAIKHVLWRPLTPENADILISGQVRRYSRNGVDSLDTQGQHLGCFTGGMFALGSKLFDIPEHLEIGKKLVNGCIWAYKAMPTGIMPEVFRMASCNDTESCVWSEDDWLKVVPGTGGGAGPAALRIANSKRLPKGMTHVVDPRYILRPEAIESVFLLYRMTGEQYLLDDAWEMFTAISNATQTPLGNAALKDINPEDGQPKQADSMESFWMAETLKYFYLIFSEPDHISLDEYVFNTEAHPFKRPV